MGKNYLCLAVLFCAALGASGSPPGYLVETMAGSSNLGDGGAATAAQFGIIKGIALDLSGNLYIADTDHQRIRKVNAAGTVTTIAGTGTTGFSGDGGPATAAQLNSPYGLAVDQAGYLYVADLGNNRVRRIAPNGTILTIAGNGQAGSGGDYGPAINAQLMSPRNLAVDAAGNLYIAEFAGQRIRVVAPAGTIATAVGTGIAGFNADGAGGSATQLNSPAGLTFDSAGALWIADSGNSRVRKLAGGKVTTAGGPWTDSTPVAVTVGHTGTVYMADSSSVVLSYTAAGGWARAAGTGTNGFAGDGGPAAQAILSAVWALATDSLGNIYLADGARVRRIDNRGIVQTVAGDGYLTAVGDGAAATSAQLLAPMSVALDGAGDLYIADSGTNRIRQMVPAGTIRTMAGTGVAGQSPDDVPATAAALKSPMGVAPGPAGNWFIADTYNHRIRMVDANGLISTFAGTGIAGRGAEGMAPAQMELDGPRGVCTDRAGDLYIADTSNHRVLRIAAGAAVTQTAAGNGGPGAAGDGGAAPLAQLNQPTACVLDTAGNLFIADTGNHRIRKVTPGGAICTVAGTGYSGNAGDEGPATAAQLDAPQGIAVEDDGTLFIADTNNHRIREVTSDGVIHSIAGTGSAGFAGDGDAALSALLNAPAGLVLDGAGDLYFADSGNNRVRRLLPQQVAPPAPVVQLPAIAAVNAASLSQGPVAPGEVVVIFGQGIGPDVGTVAAPDAAGMLPTSLGGVQVLFDGIAAPVLYAQAGQVNVQAPYTISGEAATNVEVVYQTAPAGTLSLAVAPANPALFGAAVNQDGTLNSQANPAARGTAVAFFATGAGLGNGPNIAGRIAQAPYAQPLQPVSLTMGGIAAALLYAGSAPGQVGELQVNAVVPGGFLPMGPVAVELTVGNFTSPPLTIWVK